MELMDLNEDNSKYLSHLNLSPNSLLTSFEDDMSCLSRIVDHDPWIGNAICDQINLFNDPIFDDDDFDSCKSSPLTLSPNSSSSSHVKSEPLPVHVKCEVDVDVDVDVDEIDNEVEISDDCQADSPLSYTSSHSGSSSASGMSPHNYDIHTPIPPNQLVLISHEMIKKEPSSNKSTPKSSPKSRASRNKQITDLILTEEEKRLLTKEGYDDFPTGSVALTKHEEKILRKIRRKIRNKKSAQCSRQRKKEYLEDLEKRFDEKNHENEQLKKEVMKLKRDNDTLMVKMKKLLTIGGHGNASFKSSFFIIILSFLLILVPCFRPNQDEGVLSDNYLSKNVGRNLLTLYSSASEMGSNLISDYDLHNETTQLNFTNILS